MANNGEARKSRGASLAAVVSSTDRGTEANPSYWTGKAFNLDSGGDDDDNKNPGSPSYVYGSSGPTQAQKDTANNLLPVTLYGQDNILNKAGNMDDVYTIADQATNNFAESQGRQAEKSAGAEWFSRLLNEQSTYDQLRNTMGNARYGAGALDLNQKVQRVHDANAVDVLENLESQLYDVDLDRLNALQSNINASNEMAANTEASLGNLWGDYAAQMNNILGGDSDELGDLIDSDALKLNLPEQAKDKYYADNKKDALSVGYASRRIRPRAATEQAWDQQLQARGTNNSSAANKRYWDILTNDYGHRVV